jgi:hypothetical protein
MMTASRKGFRSWWVEACLGGLLAMNTAGIYSLFSPQVSVSELESKNAAVGGWYCFGVWGCGGPCIPPGCGAPPGCPPAGGAAGVSGFANSYGTCVPSIYSTTCTNLWSPCGVNETPACSYNFNTLLCDPWCPGGPPIGGYGC